jgi:phage shock protein PspC (stress-responsive transcriptional regulator)
MITGIAGGLGEYFGVDAVIFRVLFAVLSFFGGVGLLLYALAWLLVPEPEIGTSALDKAIGKLRAHRIPPWVVILGGAVLLWLGWFSWWAPGPTFPAVLLVAVLALVLIHRLGQPTTTAEPSPASAGPDGVSDQSSRVNLVKEQPSAGSSFAGQPAVGAPTAVSPAAGAAVPLIPPLNDTRRSMQAWVAETSAAHRKRVRRRRPIKVGVLLCLGLAWAVVALLDAFHRVPFPAYLWVGLAVLGAGFLVSLLTRRMTLSLLAPIAALAIAAFALGGTRASLRDGSGQLGWKPTSVNQLADHRQFAGHSTLDLTQLGTVSSAKTVRITLAAGEVIVRLPATLNATVISDVHLGDVQNGDSHETGQYVSGLNVHLEMPPPAGSTGEPVMIFVTLTVGHVQVDQVAS